MKRIVHYVTSDHDKGQGMRELEMTREAGSFIVMCRVSGGVTGTREAQLKANGVPQFFPTREAAQAEADKLNSTPRPYATASFRYWVEEA
jgi:hypothetical protein